MLKELGFYKGVNLGGWMSQCDYSAERLDTFITEPDFARIAGWGFDHVRLPVDYNVFLTPDGEFREDGLRRIGDALSLCEKYGLRVVLDLHKTPGFSFDAQEGEAGFFENEKYQALFYRIWETFAQRWGSMGGRILFDLLNEVTEERFLPAWMNIARECVARIRPLAPDTPILVGSWAHNSAKTVKDLSAPFDDKVVYSFHCYEPIAFTHQGAYWMPELAHAKFSSCAEHGVTEAFFEELLAPALEKAEREGTELYCGEYGVIDRVPPEEALPWFRAFHAVMERHGIGRCLWSYREMDFGLADGRMDAVRPELLGLL